MNLVEQFVPLQRLAGGDVTESGEKYHEADGLDIGPPGKDNTADVNFNATAQLTGIDAFENVNGSWQQVASFSVTSGSGTFYDAAGVHLLPGDVNHDHIVNGQDIGLDDFEAAPASNKYPASVIFVLKKRSPPY